VPTDGCHHDDNQKVDAPLDATEQSVRESVELAHTVAMASRGLSLVV
jgi:hypothetical protein